MPDAPPVTTALLWLTRRKYTPTDTYKYTCTYICVNSAQTYTLPRGDDAARTTDAGRGQPASRAAARGGGRRLPRARLRRRHDGGDREGRRHHQTNALRALPRQAGGVPR